MKNMSHIWQLEAESIHILREVVASYENPVMLYSIGKDSSVLLHLARKAFFPGKPPFPLMHIDTTFKFREMIEFRNALDVDLIVHTNEEGVKQGVTPFTHGSSAYTDIMKTEGLRQAMTMHGFDAAIGGARRDEEKSRSKERVFSFRNSDQRWDPKHQRPELWHLYNTEVRTGESMRVFPLSNWTEIDVWMYILLEQIPIVPLYFAAMRPVVERNGTLIMIDDERFPLLPGETPTQQMIRFRTLGCYPLTGATVSEAQTVSEIIEELLHCPNSERFDRLIDHDGSSSMEEKKKAGYF